MYQTEKISDSNIKEKNKPKMKLNQVFIGIKQKKKIKNKKK